MLKRSVSTASLCLYLFLVQPVWAQYKWSDPTQRWSTVGPPSGTLMIHGGTFGGRGADAFLAAVGDMDALIIVIPTAGGDEVCNSNAPAAVDLRQRGAKRVVVLHTRERDVANSGEFIMPLREAKGVWISGGQQSRLAKAYLHTLAHRELFAVMERGGVVAGNSAGASIQGSFLYGGHAAGDVGFGFVKQSIIGQHYFRRRRVGSVAGLVRKYPDHLGLGIDEDTFVVVRGDTMEISGVGKVAVCNSHRPDWSERDPYEILLAGDRYDLKARRLLTPHPWEPADQWAEADKPWTDPAADWVTVGPPRGALLLTGGESDAELMRRFIELAGGPDAPIVVIPTAAKTGRGEDNPDLAALRKLGAKNAVLWHTLDRHTANSVQGTSTLGNVRGVWFSSGEAWRLADAYLHTLAHRQLFNVLDHGGIIAAEGGAARFLAQGMAGDPFNWDEGAGLLRNTIIHTWPATERLTDELVATLKKQPTQLGLGLDAGSAILVRADEFEVLGQGKVTAVDPTRRGWPWDKDEDPYLLLAHGDRFDLSTRRPNW